jgi:hypothetical protein
MALNACSVFVRDGLCAPHGGSFVQSGALSERRRAVAGAVVRFGASILPRNPCEDAGEMT